MSEREHGQAENGVVPMWQQSVTIEDVPIFHHVADQIRWYGIGYEIVHSDREKFLGKLLPQAPEGQVNIIRLSGGTRDIFDRVLDKACEARTLHKNSPDVSLAVSFAIEETCKDISEETRHVPPLSL